MNRYTKMYAWLYTTFGTSTFTIEDFKMTFPSSQPAKIIYDLINLDFMTRVKRGKYRIKKPEEFVKKIIKESLEKENILNKSNKKYAYSNSTAVNIWTDGTYYTDFTKGFKPVHIVILKKDINYWTDFFIQNDVEYSLVDQSKTLFGLTYILHPKKEIKIKNKNGNNVISLDEIVKYCKKNIFLYRPALEYIDKKYNLKIFDEHEQVAS